MAPSLTAYQDKINSSQNILIVYGRQAHFGAVAVATCVYLWLRALHKRVTIVSAAPTTVDLSHLVGINKVKNKLQGENLVIRLPLPASQIDKVVSDLDNQADRLSLIIKPKNTPDWHEGDTLPVSFQPATYDIIFYLDVRDLADVEAVTLDNYQFWTDPEHNITFSQYDNPTPISADISEVLGKNVGFAAYWAQFWYANQMNPDADQASNLLMAMERETDGFKSGQASALDFELAAWLMRQGGQRAQIDEQAAAAFDPAHHLPQIIV
ncbi:hypothetical protein IJJ12_01500 [bacterium]|nr:hypothetical protein [bacterium]